MHAPQIIFCCMWTIAFCKSVWVEGKAIDISSTLIAIGIEFGLLYWGGFFPPLWH